MADANLRTPELGTPTTAPPPRLAAGGVRHLRRTHSDPPPFHIAKDFGFAADDIVGFEDEFVSASDGVEGPAGSSAGDMSGGLAPGEDGVFGEIVEIKKAMAAEQLAELALMDPKRAKRILANRKSAARSKLRKAQYLVELEAKAHSLQMEATALSSRLILDQREIMSLKAENIQLRQTLQSMEQQAQQKDALNVRLNQEVAKLKELLFNSCDSFNLGVNEIPYNPADIHFTHQADMPPPDFQLSPFYLAQGSMQIPNQVHSVLNTVQQDSFDRY